MLKREGEAVKKGEPIARSKGVFGLFKSTMMSPGDGTIEGISSVTGQVVLREAPIPVAVDAYVRGPSSRRYPKEASSWRRPASSFQGIFGIGGERQGEIKIAMDDPGKEITGAAIDESCRGKILVGGSFLGLDAFPQGDGDGVAGIIVGGFNYQDLKPILGYDLGVAITGGEAINTTLVITEGFGRISMASGPSSS